MLAITDGETIVTLEPCSKTTSGPTMAPMPARIPAERAHSPRLLVDDTVLHFVEEHILVPTVHAMKAPRGRPFRGVLYAGLMLTKPGPQSPGIQRGFGDLPETQPILMRLKSDLLDLLDATVDGRLEGISLEWDERPSICVVMASEGYPGDYRKGLPIRGLAERPPYPT